MNGLTLVVYGLGFAMVAVNHMWEQADRRRRARNES